MPQPLPQVVSRRTQVQLALLRLSNDLEALLDTPEANLTIDEQITLRRALAICDVKWQHLGKDV